MFSQGLEKNLEDQLEIEYSSTYWLHNSTVVPTTTQRTTSTSTEKIHKSVFSTSMSSNAIEHITDKMLRHGEESGEDVEDDDDSKKETASANALLLSKATFTGLMVLILLKALY